MLKVVADRDAWRLNLELLLLQPHGHERALKEEEKNNNKRNFRVKNLIFFDESKNYIKQINYSTKSRYINNNTLKRANCNERNRTIYPAFISRLCTQRDRS